MATVLNPYLNFDGKTREAMEFYKSVFGGELDMNTYKEFNQSPDPGEDDKIMHSVLKTDRFQFMAADVPKKMEYKPGSNFSMSLSGEDEAELNSYFDKLSAGGQVTMPLNKQVWGDQFGMLIDKFGIAWMVNINAQK